MKNKDIKRMVMAILGSVAFVFVLLSVNVIDTGERAVVLRFGKIVDTWDSGLHFKMPFINSVRKYNVRVQKTRFGRNEEDNADKSVQLQAYTNDQQIIKSYRVSITWNYDPNRVTDIYKFFGSGDDSILETVISPVVQQSTKTIIGQYTARTIIQERAKLEDSVQTKLREDLKNYPINILSTQFEDVTFSEEYEKVVEETAKKKQAVEIAKNELQRIEIESQQQVAQAEAKNKAIKLEADAKAYQISVQAKAEADAIRLKADALRENKDLVNLTIAEKWNGTVPQTVISGESNSIPLLNFGANK